MEQTRKVDWGNWGITFYQSTGSQWPSGDDINEFIAHVPFSVGPQGPIDGFIGSPLRTAYATMCKVWTEEGKVPASARFYKDTSRPWEGFRE